MLFSTSHLYHLIHNRGLNRWWRANGRELGDGDKEGRERTDPQKGKGMYGRKDKQKNQPLVWRGRKRHGAGVHLHSPMARVITRRRLRTSFTTSLFCRGVARQQTTAWQRAVSSRNCFCRLSCRANSRVFPVITSAARSPEPCRVGGGRCKLALDACSGEAGFFWSSSKIVAISISQAFLKQEAQTLSFRAPLLATFS